MSDYGEIGKYLLSEGSLAFATIFYEAANRMPFQVADHHRTICAKLDEVLKGTHPTNRIIFNIPPRHSKTSLAVEAFSALGFAINPASEFMHLSSSEDLITRNVTNIRRIMDTPDYRAFFPGTRMNNTAKGSISTTAGGVMYAAPFMGQITGFGCGKLGANTFSGAMLIDDPMKAQDSYSDVAKTKINSLWSSTFKSRLNDVRTPVIVTAQRLAPDDFCGFLIDTEGTMEKGGVWDVIRFPAIIDDGFPSERALWESRIPLRTLKEYRNADKYPFETQYMQNPLTPEGQMYTLFRTYCGGIPLHKTRIRKCMVDSADTGSDYLCAICYVETEVFNYLTDVLYTKAPAEVTETELAKMLIRNDTEVCTIESNNGGRFFARNVEAQVRTAHNNKCRFVTYPQTQNKLSRIYTRSGEVQNLTMYPEGWDSGMGAYAHWREFSRDIKGFRREGRNANDDVPDCLTATVEYRQKSKIIVSDVAF